MARYSLAVIVFCLITGGAAGLMLHHARQNAAEVKGVVEATTDAGLESKAEAEAPANPVRTDERAGDAPAAPAEKIKKPSARPRERAQRSGRAANSFRAAHGQARVTRREAAGGPTVAGHVVGGVKKTGAAVGKTFGKIGGIFRD